MHTYIGSRYVPKFMGNYDNTQAYEALCVVDNGMGTSYITKIPTPAGTPLTNTTYWAVYGSSSGAIINLQNQIDNAVADIQILMDRAVSVSDFGAKGDGVTNDTTAFNNAIAEAVLRSPNNRGAIFVPAGNYLVDGIVINNGTSIFGVGDDSIIIGNDKTKPVIEFTTDLRVATIDGIHVQYRDTVVNTDTSAVGIKCTANGQGCKIVNCYFHNVYDAIKTGIFIGWIDRCFVLNAIHNGIDVGNGNMKISNCYIENCGGHGFSTLHSAEGIFIYDNTFYKCGGNGINIAVSGSEKVYDAIINNNVISVTLGHGINFASNGGANNIIANNFIEYSGCDEETIPPTTSANSYGMVIVSDQTIITGNVISVTMNANVVIQGSDNVFTDNIFSQPGQHSSGQNINIILQPACDKIVIKGNTLINSNRSIQKSSGTTTGMIITSNIFNNALADVTIGGTVNGLKVFDNIESHPSTVTTPAFPASNAPVYNETGYDVYVTFGAYTNIGNVYINGESVGTTMPLVLLKAGSAIAVSYATATTWTWKRA